MSSPNEIMPAEQPSVAPIQNNNVDQNNIVEKKAETQEGQQDKNWRAFREARELERKQAEEASRQAKKSQDEAAALKAALDAVLNKNQPVQQAYQEEVEESEEQRIDKRVREALAKHEQESDRKRKEYELSTYPQRLANDFKDFDQICNSDNLDYLDYHFPEVAQAFAHMPQGYDKWSSIYKAVKRLIPNADSRKDQSKAEKNSLKPQSSSSPNTSTNGESLSPFKLDQKKKEENWARMQKVMNKLS